MERSIWSRIGPVAGALLGLGGVVLLAVTFDQDVDYVSPRESAEAVTGFLEANAGRFRTRSVIELGLAALLVIFVADLFERLRGALPGPARWLSTALLTSGLLLAGDSCSPPHWATARQPSEISARMCRPPGRSTPCPTSRSERSSLASRS